MQNVKDLDSHKLDLHPEEVSQWKQGHRISPIHLDVGPSGACNHRCVHCYVDWYGHKARNLTPEILENIVRDGKRLNVKSIFVAGSGEPLTNPHTPDFIKSAKRNGIDIALATNGVLLTGEIIRKVVPYLNWIRFNVLAFSQELFTELHRCAPKDRDIVMENIAETVREKKRRGSDIGVGIGVCVFENSAHEMEDLVKFARDVEVDYIAIRTVTTSNKGDFKVDTQKIYSEFGQMFTELEEKYSSDSFKVAVRHNSFRDAEIAEITGFEKCYGINFINQIDADGGIYTCGAFLGNDNYLLGSLHEQTYAEIMNSQRAKDAVKRTEELHDRHLCNSYCRCHNINKYLSRIKNPPRDVNFI